MITDDEIEIMAIEYHGYKDSPNLSIMARYRGRKFYVNSSIPIELINDKDFDFMGYIRNTARHILETLLIEENEKWQFLKEQ